MMSKKTVILANELACIVILISLKEVGCEYPKEPDEQAKKKLDEIVNAAVEYGSVGQSVIGDGRFFGCLFPAETHQEKSKDYFKKLEQMGYVPKVADRVAIVDKRYLDGGQYAGFLVDIPPMFIDEAIRELLLSYVDSEEDLKVSQDPQNNVLVFEIRLWGELGVSIIYNHQFLGGGFSGKTAYTSPYPQRDYKKLLEDVKRDIDEWVDNHPGIAKKSAQA